MTAPRVLALSLLFALMAPLGACSDDEAEAPAALEGEKAGHVRYIVYLKGDPPDLTAYKAARAAGEPTEAIEEDLRSEARGKARKLRRKLKVVSAKVVETWYLTNAFTVELPKELVATLADLDGIERIEPDVLYNESVHAKASAEAEEAEEAE